MVAAEADKGKTGNKKDKNAPEEEELSEEDLALKEKLEQWVEQIKTGDSDAQCSAVEGMSVEIRSATSTMTSVPAPLKFLAPHYAPLEATHAALPAGHPAAAPLSDVLSALAMTSAPGGSRACLRYKLTGAAGADVAVWGHEYVRHLSGEIGEEVGARRAAGEAVDDLLALVDLIVPYDMSHNAEPDAIDLLLEVDRVADLPRHVDAGNAERAARYLQACAAYLPEPEDEAALRAVHAVHMRVGRHAGALRVGLALGDAELVGAAWRAAADGGERCQLAYIMGRAGFVPDLEEGSLAVADEALRERYFSCYSNSRLPELYAALGRDLDVMEPKLPEDVYKMHLVEGRVPTGPAVDSARANLSATFVNGLVNAGFGKDKLVTPGVEDDAVHWVFKNKDHGKLSAAASLGLVMLWDLEGGLPAIDRFLYSNDPHVVAGALLGIGVLSCGVADEVDPALAILSEYVGGAEAWPRIGAALGLGVAYAGRGRADVADLLAPMVADPDTPMEATVAAALGLGLAFAGRAHGGAVEAALQALMLRGEAELAHPFGTMLALALGLLFLRTGEAVEATLEVVRTLPPALAEPTLATLRACAYAGTGDVLHVQALLAIAGGAGGGAEGAAGAGGGAAPATAAAAGAKAPPALQSTIAVLGVAMVASGEELGTAMAYRALEHLLQYGEPSVRRGVPLALALLNVSNPEVGVMDTLSRLSHDADADVAGSAVLALGFVGAGTNNARLAGILRALSSYYHKEPTLLYTVRLAQGLTHMGKGLLTLDPYHADRALLSAPALAGILTVLFAGLDMKACLGGRQHYLLYALVPALHPRMLMTLDEEGKQLSVPVRVGAAVDVVAAAGRPKTVTGFQTHTTPVLLSAGERAELGTTKYLPLTSVLEGVVVLRPNPDWVEEAE
ncbi:RPN1 [Auxenochlorella protothecoides x Auxenochlorella symbiontica]|uniref:26S proteasome non-ATPase regulatory subunit 2 homolog n=1 Tax=Auxenochlorella protothecoides TaxID=3075 RepID=A0A1D2A262_AUXPR